MSRRTHSDAEMVVDGRPALLDRKPVQLGLLTLTILLLTFSYAPFGQFYLAWIGMAPWLIFVSRARSAWRAFFWSWTAGLAFYFANMWWLCAVTTPGTIALLVYISVYWGLAAVVVRNCGLWPMTLTRTLTPTLSPGAPGEREKQTLTPPPSQGEREQGMLLPMKWAVGVSVVWVSFEWLKGFLFWGGLPWLYLGHSQTPILPMCQIADITGAYGVSLWVMLINAVVALWIMRAVSQRQLAPLKLSVASVLLLVMLYGLHRMNEPVAYAGPKVMVVQSNYPQSNTGAKGASTAEIVDFHLRTTEAALKREPGVHLVVWSETMMPPLDPDYRAVLGQSSDPLLKAVAGKLAGVDQRLRDLCRALGVDLLTGGEYASGVTTINDQPMPTGRRNSAYLYRRDGTPPMQRYDKIHLVPFGEFLPFRDSFPPLYHFLNWFNPYGYDYTLVPGSEDAMTVFGIEHADRRGSHAWRFVSPICFEDIDSRLVAAMFRPQTAGGQKRADFLVNLTNDGWFTANQNALHVQTAAFRSIENRVPTARSVNTGISGFIDSLGRVGPTVEARREGTAITTLRLDSRVTFYTMHGDAFALSCLALTGVVVGFTAARVAIRWTHRPSKADK